MQMAKTNYGYIQRCGFHRAFSCVERGLSHRGKSCIESLLGAARAWDVGLNERFPRTKIRNWCGEVNDKPPLESIQFVY
jgi:hypothetical protein